MGGEIKEGVGKGIFHSAEVKKGGKSADMVLHLRKKEEGGNFPLTRDPSERSLIKRVSHREEKREGLRD